MIDTETLSIRKDACILSIGAVNDKGDGLFRKILLKDAMKYGSIDAGTLKWWMTQDNVKETFNDSEGVNLCAALDSLNSFVTSADEIWCQGTDFDIPILYHAYAQVGRKPAWRYKMVRDLRTLRAFYPDVDTEFKGDKHNPLDDARYQMRVLQKILEVIRVERQGPASA